MTRRNGGHPGRTQDHCGAYFDEALDLFFCHEPNCSGHELFEIDPIELEAADATEDDDQEDEEPGPPRVWLAPSTAPPKPLPEIRPVIAHCTDPECLGHVIDVPWVPGPGMVR